MNLEEKISWLNKQIKNLSKKPNSMSAMMFLDSYKDQLIEARKELDGYKKEAA